MSCAGDLAVDLDVLGLGRNRPADLAQQFEADGGIAAAVIARRRFQAGPLAFQPVGAVGLVMAGDLEIVFQLLEEVGDDLLGLGRSDHVLGDQLLGIDFAGGRMAADRLVHQRLGERGLVALVVAVAAIAEQVDDHVLLELLAELDRDARDVDHRLRVVAVDVEDRRLDHLRDVGAVRPRTREARHRGEADLVVDDEVDGATDAVALQLAHHQRLGHETLAGEGGVAVQQDAQHLVAALLGRRNGAAALDLLGADAADHDRDRRLPGATGWGSATGGPRRRRSHGRKTCRGGTSRRPSPGRLPDGPNCPGTPRRSP